MVVAFFCLVEVGAQDIFGGEVTIKDFSFKRNGDYMYLNMDIDLSSLDVHNNRATLLSPYVVNEEEDKKVDLQSIGIYGRRRYYTYVRNDWNTLDAESDMFYRESECPDVIKYKAIVPFEEWINGSKVVIGNRTYG